VGLTKLKFFLSGVLFADGIEKNGGLGITFGGMAD